MRAFILVLCAIPAWCANISGVWANDGGDKVTQDELRVYRHVENITGAVKNRVWNGSKITVFGAKNEVVSFQLTLEAAKAKASNVSVAFNVLTGPGDWKIRTSGTDPLNWVNRPIELFYERYVQIQGLSFFGYAMENSQIPKRFFAASGKWVDRPDHDKMYPDALVPVELVKTFDIQAGQNQSIWCDIYIPKRANTGLYKGSVKVYEGSTVSRQIPVELQVRNFGLPDQPAAKTMMYLDNSDIMHRYVTGYVPGAYAQWDQPGGRKIQSVMDKYYQFMHRHKMSSIGENECPPADRPCDSSLGRLDGSLYTPLNGYDGPGVGTQNGIYSIGSYGTWGAARWDAPGWKDDQALMKQHLDAYGNWFQQNLPNTDAFLYLQDEPNKDSWPQVETWASWMAANIGPGAFVKSFATVSSIFAQTFMPHLQIPTTQAGVGNCPVNAQNQTVSCDNVAVMAAAATSYRTGQKKKFWLYNDGRPGVGTLDTEAEGTDPRTIPVAQYKMNVDRWFYWQSNVDSNYDTFSTATSWGSRGYEDAQKGMWGDYTPTNGNGLLVYPGTDLSHPANSYGMAGPIASIRLKNWRRGIQDADYLAMATAKNPIAVKAVLNGLMPKALWENKVSDPSWPVDAAISWSSDPNVWENARLQLAGIIEGR